jgi:DNA (cytosine-5)-methyltransferase 1
MKKLRVLDLFSGIGGFSLGLERTGGFETVAFCEIEKFPRKVLAKHWPDVPCFHDVRKLTRADIDGPVDVICGGYPCQPFSTAGRRLGQKDDRHLWPECTRLVEEFRPTWFIGENVTGHISMGLDDVLSDLEGLGYATRTFVIPACAVDARHRQDRIWVVAYANKARLQRRQETRNAGSVGTGRDKLAERCADGARATWEPEPAVGRVANGVPSRVDRLKALGNAVVPQIPELIGYAILEAERNAAKHIRALRMQWPNNGAI